MALWLFASQRRVVAVVRQHSSFLADPAWQGGNRSTESVTTTLPSLQYRQSPRNHRAPYADCVISLPNCHRSSQRLVASKTAKTLAVSGLSLISALPVVNVLSRLSRIVTPTNTNVRSNASTRRQPSSANIRSSPSAWRIAASAARDPLRPRPANLDVLEVDLAAIHAAHRRKRPPKMCRGLNHRHRRLWRRSQMGRPRTLGVVRRRNRNLLVAHAHPEVRDQRALDVAHRLLRGDLSGGQQMNLVHCTIRGGDNSCRDDAWQGRQQLFSALDGHDASRDRRRIGRRGIACG